MSVGLHRASGGKMSKSYYSSEVNAGEAKAVSASCGHVIPVTGAHSRPTKLRWCMHVATYVAIQLST